MVDNYLGNLIDIKSQWDKGYAFDDSTGKADRGWFLGRAVRYIYRSIFCNSKTEISSIVNKQLNELSSTIDTVKKRAGGKTLKADLIKSFKRKNNYSSVKIVKDYIQRNETVFKFLQPEFSEVENNVDNKKQVHDCDSDPKAMKKVLADPKLIKMYRQEHTRLDLNSSEEGDDVPSIEEFLDDPISKCGVSRSLTVNGEVYKVETTLFANAGLLSGSSHDQGVYPWKKYFTDKVFPNLSELESLKDKLIDSDPGMANLKAKIKKGKRHIERLEVQRSRCKKAKRGRHKKVSLSSQITTYEKRMLELEKSLDKEQSVIVRKIKEGVRGLSDDKPAKLEDVIAKLRLAGLSKPQIEALLSLESVNKKVTVDGDAYVVTKQFMKDIERTPIAVDGQFTYGEKDTIGLSLDKRAANLIKTLSKKGAKQGDIEKFLRFVCQTSLSLKETHLRALYDNPWIAFREMDPPFYQLCIEVDTKGNLSLCCEHKQQVVDPDNDSQVAEILFSTVHFDFDQLADGSGTDYDKGDIRIESHNEPFLSKKD